MPTQAAIRPASTEETTERIDAISCLDESVRRRATPDRPSKPGSYLEVHGHNETLLIAIEQGVTHIGRGLAAELRLDDASVSRRHAILVRRPTGARVLDDRSANGIFVNGRRVAQADLQNGDVLLLGRFVLRYLQV
ncbi:MAG: FHA domain-containing protein [Solirubrobacteraceae bacterium]|jgi:pSer/pThr/pTyr-binding forkhead associated (FHA) protein